MCATSAAAAARYETSLPPSIFNPEDLDGPGANPLKVKASRLHLPFLAVSDAFSFLLSRSLSTPRLSHPVTPPPPSSFLLLLSLSFSTRHLTIPSKRQLVSATFVPRYYPVNRCLFSRSLIVPRNRARLRSYAFRYSTPASPPQR